MQILLEKIGFLLLLFQMDENAPTGIAIVPLVPDCHGEGRLHLFLLGCAGNRLDCILQTGLREVLNIVRLIRTYSWVFPSSPTLVIARLLERLLLQRGWIRMIALVFPIILKR